MKLLLLSLFWSTYQLLINPPVKLTAFSPLVLYVVLESLISTYSVKLPPNIILLFANTISLIEDESLVNCIIPVRVSNNPVKFPDPPAS